MNRPNAFVINLRRRQDRWRQARGQFDALQPAINVRRFEAIEDVEHPYLGCTRSHKAIVSMARAQQWPLVMVMEDDIVLRDIPATIKLVDFLQQRRDWDVCFGGVSACRPRLWTELAGRPPTRPIVYRNVGDGIMEIPLTLSSVMVVYNHISYEAVLSLDEFDPSARLDVFLSENFSRKWVHVPFLAWQRSGFSDILQCETNTEISYRRSEEFLLALKNIGNRKRPVSGR